MITRGKIGSKLILPFMVSFRASIPFFPHSTSRTVSDGRRYRNGLARSVLPRKFFFAPFEALFNTA